MSQSRTHKLYELHVKTCVNSTQIVHRICSIHDCQVHKSTRLPQLLLRVQLAQTGSLLYFSDRLPTLVLPPLRVTLTLLHPPSSVIPLSYKSYIYKNPKTTFGQPNSRSPCFSLEIICRLIEINSSWEKNGQLIVCLRTTAKRNSFQKTLEQTIKDKRLGQEQSQKS